MRTGSSPILKPNSAGMLKTNRLLMPTWFGVTMTGGVAVLRKFGPPLKKVLKSFP